jgi:hypothetical protein
MLFPGNDQVFVQIEWVTVLYDEIVVITFLVAVHDFRSREQ